MFRPSAGSSLPTLPSTSLIRGFSNGGEWTTAPAYTTNFTLLIICTLTFPLEETLTCVISARTQRESTESSNNNRPDSQTLTSVSSSQVVQKNAQNSTPLQQLLTAVHCKRLDGWGSDSFSEKGNLLLSQALVATFNSIINSFDHKGPMTWIWALEFPLWAPSVLQTVLTMVKHIRSSQNGPSVLELPEGPQQKKNTKKNKKQGHYCQVCTSGRLLLAAEVEWVKCATCLFPCNKKNTVALLQSSEDEPWCDCLHTQQPWRHWRTVQLG